MTTGPICTLYLLYFFYGYLFCCQPGFLLVLDKQRWTILSLAVPCMASVVWLGLSPSMPPSGYSMAFILVQAFRGFNSWIAVLAALALARRFLTSPPSPSFAMDVGPRCRSTWFISRCWWWWPGFVVPLELGITAKFLIICILSLLLSFCCVRGHHPATRSTPLLFLAWQPAPRQWRWSVSRSSFQP